MESPSAKESLRKEVKNESTTDEYLLGDKEGNTIVNPMVFNSVVFNSCAMCISLLFVGMPLKRLIHVNHQKVLSCS